jgi:hypothetical protein
LEQKAKASNQELMSAAVLHKIGELAGGVSVGRPKHPNVFLVHDERGTFQGNCSPLPVIAIASSARKYSMCKVLPESLPQILGDTSNSQKKATASKLQPLFSTCETRKSIQGALQVFGKGIELRGAAKKFTAVIMTNACRYDYSFKDDYIRNGVHKAGFHIIDKALKHVGHNSNRILIGVARSVIIADLDFYSSDSREIIAAISVTEAGKCELSGESREVVRDHGGSGVVAFRYTAFIFQRVKPLQGERSPWNISRPFHVDSWDDELFHRALCYCASRSPFNPRRLNTPVKNEFVLDRVVEGPAESQSMEQDKEDRKSEKSTVAQQTLKTVHTSA